MVKFLIAGLWACGVTVGAVMYSFNAGSGGDGSQEPPPPMLGGLDYVKTEIISVPVLRNNEIGGYFLGRFVYTAEQGKLAKLSVPADVLIVDHVYSYLYGNPMIDFTQIKSVDLDAMRAGLRESINKRIGDDVIQDILVEQVDFLTKTEIRDNTLRRRVKSDAGETAPAQPAPSAH
ncbi:MAG: hypothetical protein AB7I79_01875 [Rhizobiaceae bacterium]